MSITTIRPLRNEDAQHVAQIFFGAVHDGTKEHYTYEQRVAWGGDAPNYESWRQKITGMIGYVAEQYDKPIGFMTIDSEGYIDLAYVSPAAAGAGIGWHLYKVVELKAREMDVSVLTTDASKNAKAFFERQGWSVVEEQTVVIRGVELTNYKMQKNL